MTDIVTQMLSSYKANTVDEKRMPKTSTSPCSRRIPTTTSRSTSAPSGRHSRPLVWNAKSR